MATSVQINDTHLVTIELRSGNPYGDQGAFPYRARCSCGWIHYGTKAEVNNAAATHDLGEPDAFIEVG